MLFRRVRKRKSQEAAPVEPDLGVDNDLEESVPTDAEMAVAYAKMAELHMRRAQAAGALALKEETDKPDEPVKSPEEIQKERMDWAKVQYEKLVDAWQEFGLAIPPKAIILEKIAKAPEIIEQIASGDERYRSDLGVLLVPPSQKVGIGLDEELRAKQGLKGHWASVSRKWAGVGDRINPDVPQPSLDAHSHDWRVLVTDLSLDGQHMGSPKSIVASTKFGELDTLGMGFQEYNALTLQAYAMQDPTKPRKLVDQSGSTWLLKDSDIESGFAIRASASMSVHDNYIFNPRGQAYQFDLLSADFRRGTIGFRPTVEIT